MPVTSQGNQYWPRYQADQLVTTVTKSDYYVRGPLTHDPRAHCLPTQFHCAPPGYQRMECKDILVYIVDYSLQEPHLIL